MIRPDPAGIMRRRRGASPITFSNDALDSHELISSLDIRVSIQIETSAAGQGTGLIHAAMDAFNGNPAGEHHSNLP
jgi:hypothetical protein